MVKHRMEDAQKGAAKRLRSIVIKNVTDKVRLGGFQISFFPLTTPSWMRSA